MTDIEITRTEDKKEEIINLWRKSKDDIYYASIEELPGIWLDLNQDGRIIGLEIHKKTLRTYLF